jgi:GDP-D-mannose 3', 5'-epimerase
MSKQLRVVVLGGTGFIGTNLVSYLKNKGYWVRSADIKRNEYGKNDADEFILCDLRDKKSVELVIDETIDEVYQLAADMGGSLYIFTGENDANVMYNSAMINLNVCEVCSQRPNLKSVFYSSSACIYPEYNQLDENKPNCEESSAYPAQPDSNYGWEKLFSENLYLAFHKNKGLPVHIARFHNIFGGWGTYEGGKEKAPAAMIRKTLECLEGEEIEVFGDGQQTRSFLYIEECLKGIDLLVHSDFIGPVNIGSEEMISINNLCQMAIDISEKKDIKIKNTPNEATGVRGRNSHNKLIREKLGWSPCQLLRVGMEKTYDWIKSEMEKKPKFVL